MDHELKSDNQMNRWNINFIFSYNFAIKNYFINFYTIALLLICSYNAIITQIIKHDYLLQLLINNLLHHIC